MVGIMPLFKNMCGPPHGGLHVQTKEREVPVDAKHFETFLNILKHYETTTCREEKHLDRAIR